MGVEDMVNIDQHVRFRQLATQVTLQCDVAKIKALLIRSISFLRTVTGAEAPILLSVEDTQLVYPLPSVKPGYSKKVAVLRLSITTAPAPPPNYCRATQLGLMLPAHQSR